MIRVTGGVGFERGRRMRWVRGSESGRKGGRERMSMQQSRTMSEA